MFSRGIFSGIDILRGADPLQTTGRELCIPSGYVARLAYAIVSRQIRDTLDDPCTLTTILVLMSIDLVGVCYLVYQSRLDCCYAASLSSSIAFTTHPTPFYKYLFTSRYSGFEAIKLDKNFENRFRREMFESKSSQN